MRRSFPLDHRQHQGGQSEHPADDENKRKKQSFKHVIPHFVFAGFQMGPRCKLPSGKLSQGRKTFGDISGFIFPMVNNVEIGY